MTLLCISLATAGADAQIVSLDRFKVEQAPPPHPALSSFTENLDIKAPHACPKKRTTSAEALRNLISSHYYNQSYISASVAAKYWTTVQVDNQNNVTITNLLNKGTTIKGVLNTENATITVPVQKLFSDEEYGDFYCVNVDIATKVYYADRPLEIKIDDDGTLTLGNWGAFVLSGEFKGYSTIRHAEVMTPARASITDYSLTKTPAVNTYPAIYVRENNHRALITNFYNYGADIVVDINADGSASIARSALAYGTNASGSTITYYNYPVSNYVSPTSYKLTSAATQATFASDSIVSAMWALSTNTTITNTYDLLEKSVIHVPETFISFSNDLTLKGSGTAADPYLIESAADLVNLSDAVNYSGKYVTSKKCFTGTHFRQTTDIDMSSVPNFEPIGTSASVTFNGIYDGDNHTISNLTINRRSTTYGGLFGILEAAGAVKNIKFINPNITSEANYAAVVCGMSKGVIDNISITGAKLSGTNYTSGIAGSFAGSLSNSSFQGTITGQNYTGGLIGMGWGQITNCESAADIITGRTGCIVGGIAGSLAGDTVVMADTRFIGSIMDKNGSGTLGGLAGYFQNGAVKRCISTAHLQSNSIPSNTTVIGGLLGLLANASLEDCVMAGQIVSSDAPTVGGLVGKVTKRTGSGTDTPLISNCLVTGVLEVQPSLAGMEFVSSDTVEYLQVKGCLYDNVISGRGGVMGSRSTSDLTSGNAVGTLSTSIWTFAKNSYPTITSLQQCSASVTQTSAAIFADGDTPASVQKSITLGGKADWCLLIDGKLSKEGHGLKISDNAAVMTASQVCSDTLVAISGGAIKYIYLKVLPKEYEGEGTAESPFLIKSRADIFRLQNAVDYNGVRYTGLHFRLAKDIDMGGDKGFYGLSGTGPDACFNGTFDGAGYKIKNWIADRVLLDGFTPTVSGSSSLMAGFFLYLGAEGVVKNLVMDSTCHITAGSHVAAIVSQNYGLVENCRNHAAVWGMNNYIGGVVDFNAENATVRRCYNDASVKCGRSMTGGIVAYNFGSVEECQNDGEIFNGIISTAYTNESIICGAGGVVGYNYGSINNCLNNGPITSPKQVGGIVGQNKDVGTVNKCVNIGIITSTLDNNYTGALIGNQLNIEQTPSHLYFDRQLSWTSGADNKDIEGATGLNTSSLTSGTLPEGLSSDLWNAANGLYPMLKSFLDEPAALFCAKAYIDFASIERTDSRFYMRRDATISIPENGVATLKCGKLAINNNTLTFGAEKTAAVDTLCISLGDMSKYFPVFASAKVLSNGSGSTEQPWLINNADEWLQLASFTDKYSLDFRDDNFAITAPLNFSGKTFARLCGSGAVKFQGKIEGNGYTISGINISDTTSASSYMGLIRALGSYGVVKNIVIDASCSFSAPMCVGAITGTNAGLIENCVNRANITTLQNYAGGLSGFVNIGGRFVNCLNEGTITASTGIAGGIAGGSNAEIGGMMSKCTNKGSISGSRIVGGLIGSSRVMLDSCANYGSVNVTEEDYGGGIVGYHTYDIPITDCENHGKVTTAKAQAGGIVGYLFSSATINRCVNYGTITSGTSHAGGILGQAYKGDVHIADCVNHGAITSTSTYAGGIAGYLAPGTSDSTMTIVSKVTNYGDITSTTNYAGGITGYAPAFTRHYNVTNHGEIYGDLYVGGCFGQLLGQADTCMNTGDVVAKRFTVGGIIGTTATTTTITARIENAINVGKVTSESTTSSNRYNIGGILGGGVIKMYNCYNVADLAGYKAVGGLVGAACKGAYSSVYKETYYGTCIYNSYSVGSITCEDGGLPGSVGHVIGTSSENYALDYTEYSRIYTDRQQCGTTNFVLDTIAKAVLPRELTADVLGDAFMDIESESCYPILKAFSGNSYAELYASALKLDNDEWTRHGVGGTFHVRSPKGVMWESSHFDINSAKGSVSWTSLTAGSTYKLNAFNEAGKREFSIVPASSSNVEWVEANRIVDTEFYTPDGMKLNARPSEGIYIEISIHSDGSRKVEKKKN